MEFKTTTDTDTNASYLDLMASISSGNLEFSLYDKRDVFDFAIVNYPFLDSNIPTKPTYGVYVSQLIRYARACTHYEDFQYRHRLLVNKLTSQGYKRKTLKQSFTKFLNNNTVLIF